MNRYALYARYSSVLQKNQSIHDQVELCRRKVDQWGGVVVAIYSDPATTGRSIKCRPGLMDLLKNVESGFFSAILTESLDRLSRSQKDIAFLFRYLMFYRIKLLTLDDDGEIGPLHVGLKGTMNALFLKNLGDKVRRGQMGRIREGRVPSGLAYGYRLDPKIIDGKVEKGRRLIIPAQAAVVRRIFEEYASGKKAWRIAADLNIDRIAPPRGQKWGHPTILGSVKQKSGILNNQIYVGLYKFRRRRQAYNPETGKYRMVPNPEDMISSNPIPQLRIIPQNLWDSVQRRIKTEIRPHRTRGVSGAFTGLVFCTDCGRVAHVKKDRLYRCSGLELCSNKRGIPEKRLAQEICNFIESYILTAAFRRSAQERLTALINRRKSVEKQEQAILNKLEKGENVRSARDAILALETEKNSLAKYRNVPRKFEEIQVSLNDNLIRLRTTIKNTKTPVDLMSLRPLVERVEFTPLAKRGQASLHIRLSFNGLFNLATSHDPEQSFNFGDDYW